jgi:hypothetical protein
LADVKFRGDAAALYQISFMNNSVIIWAASLASPVADARCVYRK